MKVGLLHGTQVFKVFLQLDTPPHTILQHKTPLGKPRELRRDWN
jgi:hypothetical protein